MHEDGLPVSAVEHYAYCPRQAALIHVEGVWTDNAHTALGSAEHQAVDRKTRKVLRDGVTTWLSLPIGSDALGVAGICDAVEFRPGPVAVEHKPIRTRYQHGAAAQQLALQTMCLEEMFGCQIDVGVVFANREHRRQEIGIDTSLRRMTLQTVDRLREMFLTRALPPRVCDARCRHCSLHDLCLVDEAGQPFQTSWTPDALEEVF